jgi:hypothetical protein
MNAEENQDIILEMVKKYGFEYICDNHTKYSTVGIGDIILMLASI